MKTLQDYLNNLQIKACEVEIVSQHLTSTTGRAVDTINTRLTPEADARFKARLRCEDLAAREEVLSNAITNLGAAMAEAFAERWSACRNELEGAGILPRDDS